MSGTTLFLDSDGTVDPSVINGFFPPVSDGLIGYYELVTASVSAGLLVNLANPALPATAIGAPTLAADGITLTSNTSGFDTHLSETSDLTWISIVNPGPLNTTASGAHAMVCVPGTNGFSALMGGYATPAPAGYFRASAYYSAGSPLYNNPALFQADSTGFRIRAARVSQANGVTVEDRTLGTATTVARADTRAPGTAGTFLLGTANSASQLAAGKHLRHLFYNRRLSDAEMTTMTTFLRADVLAAYGMTV